MEKKRRGRRMMKTKRIQKRNWKKRKKKVNHQNQNPKILKTTTPSKEVKSEGKSSAPSPTPQKKTSDEESIRQKVVEGLTQALGKQPEDILEAPDVAKDIEEELYKIFSGVEKQYKTKYRSLAFNLKNPKNPDLRAAVMNGATSATALCKMTAQDMASEDLKKQRKEYASYHLEASKAGVGVATSTDMFKCSKCKKKRNYLLSITN